MSCFKQENMSIPIEANSPLSHQPLDAITTLLTRLHGVMVRKTLEKRSLLRDRETGARLRKRGELFGLWGHGTVVICRVACAQWLITEAVERPLLGS